MPQSSPSSRTSPPASRPPVEIYRPASRALHWLTFAALAVQIPLGVFMVAYAVRTEFAAPSGMLYDGHKLLGLGILALIVLRLANRLIGGAPRDEPTLELWHKAASHLNHWGLYLLLLVTPFLGWLGTSYYGAMSPFGIKLPALVAQDEKTSEVVFVWHKGAAIALAALIVIHVAAALYHHLIRKDNVLARMIPRLLRR